MRRRIVSMLLAIVMVAGLMPRFTLLAGAATEVASGTCGTGVNWLLDSDGVLTISGNGAMTDVTGVKQPWKDYRSDITTVVIEDGITAIGAYAFYNCAELTTVTIPSSVTTIGAQAFRGCEKLSTVTIPSSVETIGQNAFYNCTELSTVTIPSSVTSIGKSAFSGCSNLSEFKYLGVTEPEVGANVFKNCDNLTTIYVPENYSGDAFPGFSGSLTKELPSGSEEEPNTACTINVSANTDKGGTVTGAGEYEKGETVTVTATANPGYTFVNWTENGSEVSTAATYSFTADANRQLAANFQKNPIVSVTIGTTTTKYSSLVDAFTAADGKTATITMLKDYDAATETRQPYMTSTSSVITFDLGGHTLSYTNLVEGSYTSRNPAFAGTVTVQNGTIEADNRYFALSGYSSYACTMTIKGDVTISTTNEYCNAVGVSGNMTLFIEEGATLTSNNSASDKPGTICVYAGGTVILNGGTIVNNGSAPAISHYNSDDNTTVVVNGGTVANMKVANAYFSVNHTAAVDGNAWYKLTNNIDTSVATVAYTENTTDYNGTIYGLGASTVKLTAAPAGGVTVSKIKANSTEATLSDGVYSFAMPKNLVSLTAEAVITTPTYSISVAANPAEGGTVSGGGNFEENASVTVAATANTGYAFVNWTENGTEVSKDASYTFAAEADRSLVANFVIKAASLTSGDNVSYYATVEAALTVAQADDVVTLLQDVETTETLNVKNGVTLDLAGKTLTAAAMVATGTLQDTGALVNGEKTGLLKVDADKLTVNGSTEQMALYDTEAGGYRFFTATTEDLGTKADGENAVKFGFRITFDANGQACGLLADNPEVKCDLTWTGETGKTVTYNFEKSVVEKYAGGIVENSKFAFIFRVGGLNTLKANDEITVVPKFSTLCGQTFTVDAMNYTVAGSN